MATVRELQNFLRSIGPNDPEKTVDRLILGNLDATIQKIGTCWMSYWPTLKKAVQQGVNVMVTHEPTFYTHLDLRENDLPYPEITQRKKEWILQKDLNIIRCHDALDRAEGFGIAAAFGRALGFTDADLLHKNDLYRVYRVEPAPAEEIARQIAAKLKIADQPGVAFYGDPGREIQSIGIGTGCGCNPREFSHLEADLRIAIDDSIRTWTEAEYAVDSGDPLVLVHHGTTEEFGVRELREAIQKQFPDIEVIHFSQGCGYRWISAGE